MSCTAPKRNTNVLWPISGLFYVSAFMGPISAGPLVGLQTRDWRAVVVGLLLGIGIAFLNAWLIGRFVDPWIARFQTSLRKGVPRVLANTAAFAWAFALSALAMIAPVTVLGSAVLTQTP
jgi:hypothetical protein